MYRFKLNNLSNLCWFECSKWLKVGSHDTIFLLHAHFFSYVLLLFGVYLSYLQKANRLNTVITIYTSLVTDSVFLPNRRRISNMISVYKTKYPKFPVILLYRVDDSIVWICTHEYMCRWIYTPPQKTVRKPIR